MILLCTHEPQYAAQVGRDRKLRNIGNEAREAGFSFKALSCTSFGFLDPVALMRGLASMILNRDLLCDDHYNDSLCDIIDP